MNKYETGKQPCGNLKRQREGNEYGDWLNVHCCYRCDLTVTYCENCRRDHHENGYEACSTRPTTPRT